MDYTSFEDVPHADMYLRGSIIRINGVPAYIETVTNSRDGPTILYKKLGRGEDMMDILLSSPHVDMLPFEVGMMNYSPRTVIRVARRPRRAWKVGLCNQNMSTYNLTSDQKLGNPGITSNAFRNMLMGKYPKYRTATKRHQSAFHVNWAHSEGGLYFKHIADKVGNCQPAGPDLLEKFDFLQGQLDKDMVNVGI